MYHALNPDWSNLFLSSSVKVFVTNCQSILPSIVLYIMSRLYDFIYHIRWCTYIKHDVLHDFSRRLSRKMQEEFLFHRGHVRLGICEASWKGCLFVCWNREIFFRMVSEHEFMKIAKDKKRMKIPFWGFPFFFIESSIFGCSPLISCRIYLLKPLPRSFFSHRSKRKVRSMASPQ